MVCGPRDSGKEDLVRGVAQLMGKFLLVYPCTAHSDSATLGRILEGLALVMSATVVELMGSGIKVCNFSKFFYNYVYVQCHLHTNINF